MTKIFFIECVKRAAIVNGRCRNEHIPYKWMMAKAIMLHQVKRHFRDSLIDMNQGEFPNVPLHNRKFFFVAHPAQELGCNHAIDEKIFLTLLLTDTPDQLVP